MVIKGVDIISVLADVEKEMAKVVVDQQPIIRGIFRAILCNG